MENVFCINERCGQEFEVDVQEGAGSKQVQCPRCFRFFFVRKTGGKIISFKLDIADMAC